MAVAAAAAAATAGCASSSGQPTAPTPATTGTSAPPSASAGSAAPSPSAAAAAPACATSSLHVTLGTPNGYAGGVDQAIDFTNTSAASCTLYGYPGVSLVSGPSRTQVGLAARRAGTAPVRQVTLAPGATAHAVLQIVDALNYPTATCKPTKATAVRVYPPNQTVPVYLPTTATGCANPVTTLQITPVQPGSG
jgi:hypothetical protein